MDIPIYQYDGTLFPRRASGSPCSSPREAILWGDSGLRPANGRRRHIVTTSLIGWAQA